MDTNKVDILLQYALLVANQEDDWLRRELGPIHLLKYAYIGDLTYAAANNGSTFTGAQWQFYHYGPWSLDVFKRIEPATSAINATVKVYQSKYENDTRRYVVDDEDADEARAALERTIPVRVQLSIKRAVHTFGSDTSSLLHHVYLTAPMLNAAPRDFLDFRTVVKAAQSDRAPSPEVPLSRKAEKKQKEALESRQSRFATLANELRERRRGQKASVPPRYDEAFFEGVKWLDELGSESSVDVGGGEVEFSEGVWRAPNRREPFDE